MVVLGQVPGLMALSGLVLLLWVPVMLGKEVGEWDGEGPDKVALRATLGQSFRIVGPLVPSGIATFVKR